jgi:hypothetical protein
MPEAIEFLTNPDFHKLPLGDRLEVLRKDSNFASLNPEDQGEIISKAQQKVTPGANPLPEIQHPKDAGLFSTLRSDVKNLATSLIPKQPSDLISPGVPLVRGMIEGAKDQFKQGYEGLKKHEDLSGFGHMLAAITPGGPQAAQGAEEVTSGQPGQGAAHIIEALGPYAVHGLSEIPAVAKTGRAIGTGLKVAAPDVAAGIGKAGAGMATGAAMHSVGVPGSEFSTALLTRPGLRQAGQGLVAGAKAAVENFKGKVGVPAEATPVKSLNLSQMQNAVESRQMTHEQFEQNLVKDYGPENAKIIANNFKDKLLKTSPPSMGQPQKLASFNTLKDTVKAGEKDINWFQDRLKQQGYPDEDIELESKRLEREIEKEKRTDEEKASKKSSRGVVRNPSERDSFSLRDLKVDSPVAKMSKLFEASDKPERPPLPGETPSKDLTPPEVPGKLVGRTTGKEMPESAMGRYGPGFGVYEVPIEKVIGTEDISGNESKLADVEKYSKMKSEAPPLWGHVDENGNVSIQGARRLAAAKKLGQKTIKVAIGQDYQGPKN